MIAFYRRKMARGRTGRRSTGLQRGAGQAAVQGVNQLNQAQWLSGAKEHKQIVTSITERIEQLAGSTQLLEVVASSTGKLQGFTEGQGMAGAAALPEIHQRLAPKSLF